MDFQSLDSYEPAIQTIATNLAPNARSIDFLACDRSDYESDLRIDSWHAQLKFRERHGFCSPAERRYVYKSLWNKARLQKRGRDFRARQHTTVMSQTAPAEATMAYVEGQFEAREALRILSCRLGPEFGVLLRVGQAHTVIDAYDASIDGGSLRNFQRKILCLRDRARQILD